MKVRWVVKWSYGHIDTRAHYLSTIDTSTGAPYRSWVFAVAQLFATKAEAEVAAANIERFWPGGGYTTKIVARRVP